MQESRDFDFDVFLKDAYGTLSFRSRKPVGLPCLGPSLSTVIIPTRLSGGLRWSVPLKVVSRRRRLFSSRVHFRDPLLSLNYLTLTRDGGLNGLVLDRKRQGGFPVITDNLCYPLSQGVSYLMFSKFGRILLDWISHFQSPSFFFLCFSIIYLWFYLPFFTPGYIVVNIIVILQINVGCVT